MMRFTEFAQSEQVKMATRARPLLVHLARRLGIVAEEVSERDALEALFDLTDAALSSLPPESG